MREDRRVHQALVDLARQGDEEAFADLARAVGDRLMAIAYRILRDVDRVEDAVQQTLVTAWRELPALRDPDHFDAWLRRILVHACYAEARRRRHWTANVRILPADGPAGRDDIATVIDRDRLERAFRRLSPEQSAIFVLHHYVGLSLPEVAAELGVPLGTVKSRLHYATEALRAALDADARTATSTERLA
jgi:RNA polymerase sigma-70 factor (ECF subfamily)